MQKRIAIAREGYPVISIVAALTVALWFTVLLTNSKILVWMAVLTTIASAFILFLFRNPRRIPGQFGDSDIISPADGKIVNIGPADEPGFLKTRALRISVFLSLLDVHVNWLPVSGVVMHKELSNGKFLPAFTARASDTNKRLAVGIQCEDGFCLTIVQITGFVARRIRCHINPGQRVKRGDRYGMIYLGSRIDIFVPLSTTVTVKKGDHVHGGISVIGHKPEPNGKDKDATS
jgi:phosphatidylserine decarboxylase